MERNPTRMCEVLVGLEEVDVAGVGEPLGGGVEVEVRCRAPRPRCPGCGGPLWSKGTRVVELVDLPSFGRPARLSWRKHRWECPNPECGVGSFTEQNPEIAPERALLTTRAARWATKQVGQAGRAVEEVARELGCDWHTVNKEVTRWGAALLEADHDRVGRVEALGLDETLFLRRGRRLGRVWATSVVDVGGGQLLDVVPGRDARSAAGWLQEQPKEWLEQIRWAVLDLSSPYRAAYNQVLPHARQIADPFHVVRLANDRLDQVRRRTQQETLGHRGRRGDPLYQIRRLLTLASERLDTSGEARLRGLLDAGDPHGEVRTAWHAKETVRSVYDIDEPDVADRYCRQLASDLQHESCPPEVNQLGRTLARWHTQITNWHHARYTNAATEAVNNLIKRIKRVGFGFRNFANYRIRALLYAGKPNWKLLPTLTPP